MEIIVVIGARLALPERAAPLGLGDDLHLAAVPADGRAGLVPPQPVGAVPAGPVERGHL